MGNYTNNFPWTVAGWASGLRIGDILINFNAEYSNSEEDRKRSLSEYGTKQHVRFIAYDPETNLVIIKSLDGRKTFERDRFYLQRCTCEDFKHLRKS